MEKRVFKNRILRAALAVILTAAVSVSGFPANFFGAQPVYAEDEPTTKKITITKTWENDDESVRPDNLTVNLKRKYSNVIVGSNGSDGFKEQMVSLAGSASNISKILQASSDAYDEAVGAGVTMTNVAAGGEPLYMWFDNGKIMLYSPAENVYLNENCMNMFKALTNLTDISGLAMFNTTYVTNMAGMFTDSTKLASLAPLENWDTGNVTSMRFMFGANVTNDDDSKHMHYTSIEPLKGWNTQSVQDMGLMFKGAKYITSVDYIKDWNVSNLLNMNQMFFRTNALTDATGLHKWDVVRVGQDYINVLNNGATATGNFSQMFGRSGANTAATVPQFDNRPGTWNNSTTQGTLAPDSGPQSGSAPTNNKVRDANQYDSTDPSCTVTKNGNVWTYEFVVSNDDTVWYTWEDTTDGTHVDGKGSAGSDMYSVSGKGGSEANAITGVTESASIKNVNTKRVEITAVKQWNDNGNSAGFRPGNVNIHLNDGSTVVANSDDDTSKWTKSGNTWTYEFVLYSDSAAGDFTITEDAVSKYSNDGPVTVTDTTTSELKTGTATITNTLSTYDLTVEKKVTGNQGDKTKQFEVTIAISNAGPNQTYAVSTVSGSPSGATTITTDATGAGNAVIYLKDTDKVSIADLPEGTKYTVTEDSGDYTPSAAATGDPDCTVADDSVTDDSSGITADTAIVFTNNKQGVIPAGVASDLMPWILMILVVIMASAVFAGLNFAGRREDL